MLFLDVLMEFSLTMVRVVWAKSVVAGIGVTAIEGRAMVAGMAMAPAAVKRQKGRGTGNVLCDKNPPRGSGTTTVHKGAPANIANVILSYTPLHNRGQFVWTISFGMLVWGMLPP